MKKVMIMGCPGSGKSNLAIKLGRIKNLPVYQIKDDILSFNHSDKEKEMWIKAIANISEREKWIIEGSQKITFEERMIKADTIIFIDEKPIVCLSGYIKRSIKNWITFKKGTLPFRWSVVKKIFSYRRDFAPLIMSLISEHQQHLTFIELTSKVGIKKFLKDTKGEVAT